MRIIAPLCFLMIAVGCAPASDDFGAVAPEPARQMEIPAEVRAQVLPNSIFTAVYNNDVAELRRLAKERPGQLIEQNSDGNTPLGLALSLGLRESTLELLKHATAEQLRTPNMKGESYVYLAARAGFAEAITWIGEKYMSTVAPPWPSAFADVDFEVPRPRSNSHHSHIPGLKHEEEEPELALPGAGQRAIFVAANRQVAEALEEQYKRDFYGLSKVPVVGNVRDYWATFFLPRDHEERTFLHTAGESGRSDLILWAVDRLCAPGDLEKNENPWISVPTNMVTTVWNWFETTLPEEILLNSPTAQLFNRMDKRGRTPLHAALEARQIQAARDISSCRWIDYWVRDAEGNLPAHRALKALDEHRAKYDERTRANVLFIVTQTTAVRPFYTSTRWNLETPDNNGDTPMHLAARLADSYFFEYLLSWADPNVRNAQGQTAMSIYEQRRQAVERYGR